MPPHRPIHIALTFNDKYWALAYTVMRSICLSSRLRAELVFHLCHSALTPDHLETLCAITTEFGAELRHYDPAAHPAFAQLTALLPANDRFPSIVYMRLLLDKLLPAEVDRIIYLDCDTMVCQPIERLYDIDMGNKPIAAAFDPFHLGIKKGHDIRWKQTPFETGDSYFNSGVLLIDLKRYAAADIQGHLKAYAEQGVLKSLFFDQDMLNLIFLNDWQKLNWRFNVLNPLPAHESMHPVIVHYTGFRQPWKIGAGHRTAFGRTYRHVMTNEVYYRFLAERSPAWLRPLIGWISWQKSRPFP